MEPRPRYQAPLWTLQVNWPAGEMPFEASGYGQYATGPAALADHQQLLPGVRAG